MMGMIKMLSSNVALAIGDVFFELVGGMFIVEISSFILMTFTISREKW